MFLYSGRYTIEPKYKGTLLRTRGRHFISICINGHMGPKLQYIQKVKVHIEMVELYQQFLLKIGKAYENTGEPKPWRVYENVFSIVSRSREFIFVRFLDRWADLDKISVEDSLSKVMASAYGENEAMKWMQVIQKSVKSIETLVLSQLDQY